MAWDWGNFGQGFAGGASAGTMIAPGLGTAIGGLLGGLAGGLTGQDDQQIPDFDAAERARTFMQRYGRFGEKVGAVGASADSLGRMTAAQLISAGVDPVTAQNIATRRAAAARSQGLDSTINAETGMEAQLAGNLLPYEIGREEDQISLRNLQANEPSVFESFIPLIGASAFTGDGGRTIGDWLSRSWYNRAGNPGFVGPRIGG